MAKQIIARFDSYCYETNQLIKRGEVCIYHTKLKKVFHPLCKTVKEVFLMEYTNDMLI